jgi:hypothetical protein
MIELIKHIVDQYPEGSFWAFVIAFCSLCGLISAGFRYIAIACKGWPPSDDDDDEED